jgi:hypothetical protein
MEKERDETVPKLRAIMMRRKEIKTGAEGLEYAAAIHHREI